MPHYLVIERENGIDTEVADRLVDHGSGIRVDQEMPRGGRIWVVAAVCPPDDRGVSRLIVEPK